MKQHRQVPGLEKYPDLEARYNQEKSQLPASCGNCMQDQLNAQYMRLVDRRQRAERFSIRPTGRT
jgi:hypothetical protein